MRTMVVKKRGGGGFIKGSKKSVKALQVCISGEDGQYMKAIFALFECHLDPGQKRDAAIRGLSSRYFKPFYVHAIVVCDGGDGNPLRCKLFDVGIKKAFPIFTLCPFRGHKSRHIRTM